MLCEPPSQCPEAAKFARLPFSIFFEPTFTEVPADDVEAVPYLRVPGQIRVDELSPHRREYLRVPRALHLYDYRDDVAITSSVVAYGIHVDVRRLSAADFPAGLADLYLSPDHDTEGRELAAEMADNRIRQVSLVLRAEAPAHSLIPERFDRRRLAVESRLKVGERLEK